MNDINMLQGRSRQEELVQVILCSHRVLGSKDALITVSTLGH
jgi:hypothetical protein